MIATVNLYSQERNQYRTLLTSQHIKADSLKQLFTLEIVQRDGKQQTTTVAQDAITGMTYDVIVARQHQDVVVMKNTSPAFSDSTLYQLASVTAGSLILINNIKIKIKDADWIDLDNVSLYIKE